MFSEHEHHNIHKSIKKQFVYLSENANNKIVSIWKIEYGSTKINQVKVSFVFELQCSSVQR